MAGNHVAEPQRSLCREWGDSGTGRGAWPGFRTRSARETFPGSEISSPFCRMGEMLVAHGPWGALGKLLISKGLAERIWKSGFQRTQRGSPEP